jgi:hypothetical protein
MADTISTEEAIAALGGPLNTDPVTEPTTTEPPVTEPATPPVTEPVTEPNPADTTTSNEPATPPVQDKSHEAFIHMRQQNANLTKLLKGIGQVLEIPDIDLNDENKLTAALQAKVTTKQADVAKVPVEFLTRMQALEQRDLERVAVQRKDNAARGFQTVKDTYGLTQEQLNNFASELINNGINPLEQDNINLVDNYRLLHFTDIIQSEVAKAVAAEQARAAKAGSSASTPNSQVGTGGGGSEPGKVNSVRELELFLANQLK